MNLFKINKVKAVSQTVASAAGFSLISRALPVGRDQHASFARLTLLISPIFIQRNLE